MRGFLLPGLSIALAACGLSVVGADAPSTSVPSADGCLVDGAPTLEEGGSIDAPAGPTDATTPDAKAVDTGCVTYIDDDFSTLKPEWVAANNALHDPVTRTFSLTTKDAYLDTGGIWWRNRISFTGTLTATVGYAIKPGTKNGVGLALAWAANPTFRLGQAGLNYGICNGGLSGVAVGLRVSPTQRLDAIVGIDNSCDTNGGVTEPIPNTGQLIMVGRTKSLVARIPGGSDHTRTDVTVAPMGYFGVTASTGTAGDGESEFLVTSVKLESCP